MDYKYAGVQASWQTSSSRPPESRSIVATALAVSTGCRSPLSRMRVPTRSRSVTAATAASAAIGSHCGTTRWSVNVMLEAHPGVKPWGSRPGACPAHVREL
jgi:hypothetical protein